MNGLAGLSYATDDQQLTYKSKSSRVISTVACMAANEQFKISLATKTKLVYSFMFRVVTFDSESWMLCEANQWKVNAFGMCTWKRLLKTVRLIKKRMIEFWNQYSPHTLLVNIIYCGKLSFCEYSIVFYWHICLKFCLFKANNFLEMFSFRVIV